MWEPNKSEWWELAETLVPGFPHLTRLYCPDCPIWSRRRSPNKKENFDAISNRWVLILVDCAHWCFGFSWTLWSGDRGFRLWSQIGIFPLTAGPGLLHMGPAWWSRSKAHKTIVSYYVHFSREGWIKTIPSQISWGLRPIKGRSSLSLPHLTSTQPHQACLHSRFLLVGQFWKSSANYPILCWAALHQRTWIPKIILQWNYSFAAFQSSFSHVRMPPSAFFLDSLPKISLSFPVIGVSPVHPENSDFWLCRFWLYHLSVPPSLNPKVTSSTTHIFV